MTYVEPFYCYECGGQIKYTDTGWVHCNPADDEEDPHMVVVTMDLPGEEL